MVAPIRALLQANISVQYCMALPSQMLNAVSLASVTSVHTGNVDVIVGPFLAGFFRAVYLLQYRPTA